MAVAVGLWGASRVWAHSLQLQPRFDTDRPPLVQIDCDLDTRRQLQRLAERLAGAFGGPSSATRAADNRSSSGGRDAVENAADVPVGAGTWGTEYRFRMTRLPHLHCRETSENLFLGLGFHGTRPDLPDAANGVGHGLSLRHPIGSCNVPVRQLPPSQSPGSERSR